jgi:hypothetical protein
MGAFRLVYVGNIDHRAVDDTTCLDQGQAAIALKLLSGGPFAAGEMKADRA